MFRRPPQIPHSIAGPSTAVIQRRCYAVSVRPPRKWPNKEEERTFDERKTFLFNHLTRLLSRSSSEPILFLRHNNFRANALSKLRREISMATLPKGMSLSLMDAPPTPEELPQFSVIRTSIFGVALRKYAPMDSSVSSEISKLAGHGGLAVLTLPTLDPPKLNAVLKAFDRAVPKKKVEAVDSAIGKGKSNGKEEDDGFIPGRRQKRRKPILVPELTLLGALVEGRVFGVGEVQDLAKLPTLDTLRSQIVALISSPAVQLAMVLGEASGGRLARTLDGLKKGLEEKEAGPPS